MLLCRPIWFEVNMGFLGLMFELYCKLGLHRFQFSVLNQPAFISLRMSNLKYTFPAHKNDDRVRDLYLYQSVVSKIDNLCKTKIIFLHPILCF